jgi:septal ring factor EnvC (AmiA/AmiB activator)
MYLGMSAALFAYRVDYKNMVEKEQKAHKKTIETKDNEIGVLKGKITDLNNNIKTLEGQATVLKQELDRANNDLTDWKTLNTKLTNDLNTLNANYEKLQAALNEQIQKNKELNETLEKTQSIKDDATKERVVLEEKFLNAQDTIIKLEKNLSALEQQYLAQAKELNQLKIIVDQLRKTAPSLLVDVMPVKLIEGKIIAVSDKPALNIVVISVGKNDGVEVGMRFTVYRADKYVAKIQVDKVEAQWSSCFSIKEFQADAIRINDNITTSPY